MTLISFFCSDYRSSNVGPSDSEKDVPSRRDSEILAIPGASSNISNNRDISSIAPPRLGVTAPSNDSESGGSHPPSPRASRKRQV